MLFLLTPFLLEGSPAIHPIIPGGLGCQNMIATQVKMGSIPSDTTTILMVVSETGTF